MRLGIAADHGAFVLKGQLKNLLRHAGHEVIDFGAYTFERTDDYPDFVIPLAQAVAAGNIERGIALCGSGIGASIAANKVASVRAGLVHDIYSAHQGVEDDNMNVCCFGGKIIGSALAWELLEAFVAAQFHGSERFLRRLAKVREIEVS